MALADDMSDGENWTGGFYELSLVLGLAMMPGWTGRFGLCGAPQASRGAAWRLG